MRTKFTVLLALLALAGSVALAQRSRNRTPPPVSSFTAPEWKNDPEFAKDVFTWVRLKYVVNGRHEFGHTADRWAIDFPDCDSNFSYRLQQMSSVKVDPEFRALSITEKELFGYPFLYVVEPGRLTFEDDEIPVLRKYLLNGGFMMVDDFWGDEEWNNFEFELELLFPPRQFPKQKWVDLPMDHPIFNGIFTLTEKPRVPNYDAWERYGPDYIDTRRRGTETPHYRAVLDDKGRIMILICHNTDLGDAWEREGTNPDYFHTFSEKLAYPLGINIIFYAMTH